MTSAGAVHAQQMLRQEKELRGLKCEACGKSQGEEFHHLRPTGLSGRGRGLIRRAYDIRRNRRSYRLLCRPCHLKEHASDDSERRFE